MPGKRFPILVLAVWSWAGLAAADGPARAGELTELPLEKLLDLDVQDAPKFALDVSGASKFPQKVSEAPSAVTIITADDITTYGWRTLAEVLRSVRGFYLRYDRNYSYVGTRGFGRPGDYNNRMLVLIDGYRQNDTIYDQALIGTEGLLDLGLIERIEVIPGPGSAIYGSNAFFGVINIITKQGVEYSGGELSAQVASYDTHKGRATFGQRFGNGLDLVVSASLSESAGRTRLFYPVFDTPETNFGIAENLDDDRYQRYFGKLSFQGLTLEAAYAEHHKGIPTAAFNQVFNDPRSESNDASGFINLQYRSYVTDGLLFYGSAHYGSYRYVGNFVFDNPPTTLNIDVGSAKWAGLEVRFVSNQFDRHRLVFGGDYENDFERSQKNFDKEPGSREYLDSNNPAYRFGLYLQDEFSLLDNLKLDAGLRFDYNSVTSPLDSGDRLAYRSVNPRLALIYQPLPSTTLKLLYGTAFRRPSAYEMAYGTETGEGLDFQFNPNVKPERIKTYEAVIEHSFDRNLRVLVTGFYYQTSDLITQEVNANDKLQYFNSGRAEAHGLELELEHFWDNGARLRASYSWQETRDTERDTWLVNSPHHLAKLNLSLPLYDDKLRAGVELQYIGARKTLTGVTQSGRIRSGDAAGDYVLANLTLTSENLWPGLEISGSLYNLFDTRFADPASDEHEMDVIRQDGRQLRLKFTYRF